VIDAYRSINLGESAALNQSLRRVCSYPLDKSINHRQLQRRACFWFVSFFLSFFFVVFICYFYFFAGGPKYMLLQFTNTVGM
jgi:hypothetical protein